MAETFCINQKIERTKNMATITDAKLTIDHNHSMKTAHAVVTCTVNFTGMEQCLMQSCPEMQMFKLKCKLWGDDSGFTGKDDDLWTYSNVYYFPDGSVSATESCTFDVTLGEGVLDEDIGKDEVFGRLYLDNLFTMVTVKKKTNTVKHRF